MSSINSIKGLRADRPCRPTIRVCAPVAHQGIGDALRRAFASPPPHAEDELQSLLRRL